MAELGQYGGFLDQLLAALKKRAGYNEDLIGQRNQLETDFYNPPDPSKSFKGVWNPADRIRLAEGRRAQAGTSLNTFNDLIKQREGSQTDLASAVARGYQEQQEAEQRAFQNKMAEEQLALSKAASAREGAQFYNPGELMSAYPNLFGGEGPSNPNGPKLPPSIIASLYEASQKQKGGGFTPYQLYGIQKDQADAQAKDKAAAMEFYDALKNPTKMGAIPATEAEAAKRLGERFGSAGRYGVGLSKVSKDVQRWMKERKSPQWIEQKVQEAGYTMERVAQVLSKAANNRPRTRVDTLTSGMDNDTPSMTRTWR